MLLSFNFYTSVESDLCTIITVLEYSEFDYIFTFTGKFYTFICFYVVT